MKIITDISELRENLSQEQKIAFVPTMGNLHSGHLALIDQANQLADCVIVSIFVNRLQFLPHEDFNRYPRTFEEDCNALSAQNVKIVFAPDEKILFPTPQEFLLALPPVADILEGKFRPGFFRGVATIVLKLFNIIQPEFAIFGKKDYQQLHIVRKMVQQLNLPVEIIANETVRAADGLALSSRNQYLDEAQRSEACRLYQTLLRIKQKINSGSKNFQTLQESAISNLEQHGWKVDYISIHQRSTLLFAQASDQDLVVLGAAWLNNTRLIDNLEI
ncbi:pantoate--beta-alanine ligase [Nitrosomonas supralitoralis]|uniref:Pantothenate synthetase n=1 Tax=Nitrosomonas supralitoralis TaxID=2116706 RepID=A0A2P7NVQ8_9PROT|nr:pantoate--beta-alanine ligase [Nitrosomonas supralitoralis]PSJ17528.1 pantoate--beta-alanine ligase [Nitrosomonas supralitoralis]